jgi:hypothetical protein
MNTKEGGGGGEMGRAVPTRTGLLGFMTRSMYGGHPSNSGSDSDGAAPGARAVALYTLAASHVKRDSLRRAEKSAYDKSNSYACAVPRH